MKARTDNHLLRGAQWRLQAEAVLGPITQRLAVSVGAKPGHGDLLVLDQWAVDRASECLAHVRPDEDFEESVRTARRRVGLAVLAQLRDEPGLDPLTAFEIVIAERSERFRGGLLDWLDGLGHGGRSAMAAEACAYAVAVATAIGLHRLREVRVSAPSEHLDWDVPRRAVRVRGRADVLYPKGARPHGRRLLVTTAGSLTDAEATAAHAALAYTLNVASVPDGVTVFSAAVGSQRVEVDDQLLDDALSRVAAAAHAAMAARFGPTAVTTSGPWCRQCGRSGACDEGDQWVAATPIRFGGLLAER